MKYLRITDETFGFMHDDIHIILETDIKISNEDFEHFFISQGKGKQYKIKDSIETDNGLFGYVEEFIPTPIEFPKTETEILREELITIKKELDELKKFVFSQL